MLEKNKGKYGNLNSNSGPIHRGLPSTNADPCRRDFAAFSGGCNVGKCQSARPRPANVFEGVDSDVRGAGFLNCCFHLSAAMQS